MSESLKSSKMGTDPIGKLLLKMSLPAMLSMLVQALYNIVDSVFVSRISETALDAITLVFPMQMLVLAFSLGIGVGTNSIVSRKLGEGKRDEASMCAQTGLFLALVMSGVFAVIGYGISYAYIKPFTKDSPEVFPLAMQYLSIVTCVSFGQMIEILCEKVLQATGNMNIPTISQLIGAITNMILDPIFIFALKMGIAGAAVATVLGQIAAMSFVLIVIAKKDHGIQIFFKNFKFKKEYFLQIFRVGFPTMVMNAVASFTTIFMNTIMKAIHDSLTPITVLGSYFKVQSFVFMPVFGLTQGALPIMGYNYGANNKKRFVKTFQLSLIISFSIMVIGVIIFQTMPHLLMKIFDAQGELLEMGTLALRIISLCFIGAAFGIVMTTMFQSLGRGLYSLLMSLMRQILLLLPAAFLFGKLWGINAVWFAYPFAETLTFIVFLPIAIITIKKAFKLSTDGNTFAADSIQEVMNENAGAADNSPMVAMNAFPVEAMSINENSEENFEE